MKKGLVFISALLLGVGVLTGCGKPHSHNYGEVTYTWAEDLKTCTATRICLDDESHVDTETVNTTYVVVTAAKCEEDGTGRYTADFTSEAFVDQTKDIKLDAIGHNLTAHAATGETCTTAGNTAYWNCENCGKSYSDAEGKTAIENNSWIIPAHAHELTKHDKVDETCTEDGNIEYWTCNECNQYFLDEAGAQLSSAEAVVVEAHHTLEHNAKIDETCDTDGVIEYWHCTACNKDFFDEAATSEINDANAFIIPAHHTLTHHDAIEEKCEETGNIEYWTCDVCGKYFIDEGGTSEIDSSAVVIAKKGHAWGEATYTWSDDLSSCQATRTCSNDESHVETETVNTTYCVLSEPEGENDGTYGYLAKFENEGFGSKEAVRFNYNYDADKTYCTITSAPTGLTGNVTLPAEIGGVPVKVIGEYAFSNKAIPQIVIPEGITTIGEKAFYGSQLTSMTLPATITSVGNKAFDYCDFYAIHFNGTLEQWIAVEKGTYNDNYFVICADGVSSLNGKINTYPTEKITDFFTAHGFTDTLPSFAYEGGMYGTSLDESTPSLDIYVQFENPEDVQKAYAHYITLFNGFYSWDQETYWVFVSPNAQYTVYVLVYSEHTVRIMITPYVS